MRRYFNFDHIDLPLLRMMLRETMKHICVADAEFIKALCNEIAKREKMKRCYLAGPIQADPINATDWREYLVRELSQVGWIGIIPPGMLVVDLEKQQQELEGWIRSGNWDKFTKEMKKIEEGDIGALKACQAVVLYLPDENASSWGTKGEVYYAYYEMNIPIYLIYPRPISTGSFWLIHTIKNRQGDTKDTEAVFRTFPEFVKYLKEREGK